MKPFKYTAPVTEASACGLLGEGSLAFAGGTSAMNLLKENVLTPDVVVDLKRIEGLSSIEPTSSGLRIGANVTLDEVLAHDGVRRDYPVLHQALFNAATPQIRNRATLGGNLCARPACWYFSQEAFGCAKSGGSGCPAKEGENEHHAIFDTDGPCVMVHASSAAPALLALEAKVRIVGPGRQQIIGLDDFFTSPSADVKRENVLAANEIITHVVLGAPSAKSATYEVRQKATHDWPIALASVALDIRSGVCQAARIFLGAVAPLPVRASGGEKALVGQRIDAQVAARAAAKAVERARPLRQNGYKVAVAQAVVKRAILQAATGSWQ